MLQVKDPSCITYFLVNLVLWCLSQFQAECHVIIYGHMGIKGIVLEYHCNIPVLWFNIVHQLVIDVKFAGRNVLQTSNHTKGGGLTTS